MNNLEYIKERYSQLPSVNDLNGLGVIRQKAFDALNKMGIPTTRHEEWKYTRIGSFFNKEYQYTESQSPLNAADLASVRLPGYEQANELIYINGRYSSELSVVRSKGLTVQSLQEAAKNEYKDIVAKHLGVSSNYLKDGIIALSTAFVQDGVFVHVKKGQIVEHPIYIYNITDARQANILAQPRTLVYVGENAQVKFVETFNTLGTQESFTNRVIEIVVEKDAITEYYKIQTDASHASQVATTHIQQIGKSYTHTVTVSLNAGLVRNNLNIVLDEQYCEAHLYGIYLQQGQSHIDNHTVVDHAKPHCESNELYKGMLDDQSTGVFNGKIFVRQDAQKTNAYQSNKNVLLSEGASVNTKPQLEIFADDVKCSHGCTIGRLDDESLFYLRSRGIPESTARSLLLHGFAVDILEQIKLAPIREYVDKLISERLEFNIV
ncbi:MAG TPA: Fe-S cluster assembly protein SufD [Niastella sp.]